MPSRPLPRPEWAKPLGGAPVIDQPKVPDGLACGLVLRLRRLIHTTWLRLVDFMFDSRWILLSLALAVVGLLGIWVAIPLALHVAFAVTSLVLLWSEWRQHVTELRALTFVERVGDEYADVAASYDASSRFTLVEANRQHVVLDRFATTAISEGRVRGTLASANYVLPHELKAGVRYRSVRVKRRDTYNGHVLGLDANLGGADEFANETWQFVPARYWDHLASDIMASKLTLRRGEPVETLGRSLYVDRRGSLRDFGDSWLLNGVGTSLLAITTDQRLVLVSQSELNESSGGLLAPSASGSLEPQDMRGANSIDVALLAAKGALRELAEETAVMESDVGETAFLGFGRWIEKAAKPEMWTVARLVIDSHEVMRRRILGYEKPFTTRVQAIRMRDTASWNVEDSAVVIEGIDRLMLSVPLIVGLRLMIEETARNESIAGALIRRSMAAAR